MLYTNGTLPRQRSSPRYVGSVNGGSPEAAAAESLRLPEGNPETTIGGLLQPGDSSQQ